MFPPQAQGGRGGGQQASCLAAYKQAVELPQVLVVPHLPLPFCSIVTLAKVFSVEHVSSMGPRRGGGGEQQASC